MIHKTPLQRQQSKFNACIYNIECHHFHIFKIKSIKKLTENVGIILTKQYLYLRINSPKDGMF